MRLKSRTIVQSPRCGSLRKERDQPNKGKLVTGEKKKNKKEINSVTVT
jgi:hypothetical protein